MVAEGVGDDGCGHVKDVLAHRGGAAGDAVEDAEHSAVAVRLSGASVIPARRQGNSQREFGLVAVFMLSHLLIQTSRGSANVVISSYGQQHIEPGLTWGSESVGVARPVRDRQQWSA